MFTCFSDNHGELISKHLRSNFVGAFYFPTFFLNKKPATSRNLPIIVKTNKNTFDFINIQ